MMVRLFNCRNITKYFLRNPKIYEVVLFYQKVDRRCIAWIGMLCTANCWLYCQKTGMCCLKWVCIANFSGSVLREVGMYC